MRVVQGAPTFRISTVSQTEIPMTEKYLEYVMQVTKQVLCHGLDIEMFDLRMLNDGDAFICQYDNNILYLVK